MSDVRERVLAVLRECEVAEDQPPHPRFSNASECLRRHVYDAQALADGTWRATMRRPARWNAAAVSGTALGEWMEKAAQRLGAQSQVRATLEPGVNGSADLVWPGDVWDWKWVSDWKWREVKRGPDAKHVFQVNGYAHSLGLPRWALIYLPHFQLGKGESFDFLAYDGETDAEMAGMIGKRWAVVAEHVAAKTLPEREHVETDFACRVCRHKQTCWEAK